MLYAHSGLRASGIDARMPNVSTALFRKLYSNEIPESKELLT